MNDVGHGEPGVDGDSSGAASEEGRYGRKGARGAADEGRALKRARKKTMDDAKRGEGGEEGGGRGEGEAGGLQRAKLTGKKQPDMSSGAKGVVTYEKDKAVDVAGRDVKWEGGVGGGGVGGRKMAKGVKIGKADAGSVEEQEEVVVSSEEEALGWEEEVEGEEEEEVVEVNAPKPLPELKELRLAYEEGERRRRGTLKRHKELTREDVIKEMEAEREEEQHASLRPAQDLLREQVRAATAHELTPAEREEHGEAAWIHREGGLDFNSALGALRMHIRSDRAFARAVETLLLYATNVREHPGTEAYRIVRSSNRLFSSRLVRERGGGGGREGVGDGGGGLLNLHLYTRSGRLQGRTPLHVRAGVQACDLPGVNGSRVRSA